MATREGQLQPWQRRSPHRLSDREWQAIVDRVRGEFAEMPCLRLTHEQARLLLGLDNSATQLVLAYLAREGYLARTPAGEYVRRSTMP